MDHTSPTPFRLLTLAVFITLLICFTFIDLGARDDFVKLNKNVDQIAKSIEAIDHAQETTQKASLRGDGILSKLTCMPDLRCPYIQRTWYVGLGVGEEQKAMIGVMAQSGYEPKAVNPSCIVQPGHECYLDGNNTESRVDVAIGIPSSVVALKDIAPKVWRKVLINANLK